MTHNIVIFNSKDGKQNTQIHIFTTTRFVDGMKEINVYHTTLSYKQNTSNPCYQFTKKIYSMEGLKEIKEYMLKKRDSTTYNIDWYGDFDGVYSCIEEAININIVEAM